MKHSKFLEIDIQFSKYMIDKRSYLRSGLTLMNVSQELKIPKEELIQFISEEYQATFSKVIHIFRCDEAMKLWEDSPELTNSEVAKLVGYDSTIIFLYQFFIHTSCLPNTWKRKMGIVY